MLIKEAKIPLDSGTALLMNKNKMPKSLFSAYQTPCYPELCMLRIRVP